ncbi:MAG: hypothetical protein K2H87_05000 [Duncaniella sp.]|nr:hypothetical protein [Duncaniella sp.]
MKLFNKDGKGAQELTAVLGLISNRVDFDAWAPLLPFGIRDVAAIVGAGPVEALARFYETGEGLPAEASVPLGYLRQAVAMFTWLKVIPTLDAQHDTKGRSRRMGENEKGLTALQEFKDEANIQRLAYEAVDALIESLDAGGLEFWTSSPKYAQRAGLLVRDKETFDRYYVTGSHRLFLTLLPMIREVQSASVAPVVGPGLMPRLLAGDGSLPVSLMEKAQRVIVLLSMKKAVERLPVEVLPEGVVQVNQSTPVAQKLRAEKEARASVAAALGADAAAYICDLEDEVKAISGDTQDAPHLPGPLVHSKGISF